MVTNEALEQYYYEDGENNSLLSSLVSILVGVLKPISEKRRSFSGCLSTWRGSYPGMQRS